MDKVLYSDPYLSLHQADGWYTYAHMSRSDGKLVAVLVVKVGIDNKVTDILVRHEKNPAHGNILRPMSITGGVEVDEFGDDDKAELKSALLELKEEAGYDAKEDELVFLGDCYPSKQEDTLCSCFLYVANDKVRGEAEGDGSKGEEEANCEWEATDKALSEIECPLVSYMLLKAVTLKKVTL